MNFRGRSVRNLDPKGRLILSPEYRESLALRMLNNQNNNIFNKNSSQNNLQNSQSFFQAQNPQESHDVGNQIKITELQAPHNSQNIIQQENSHKLPLQNTSQESQNKADNTTIIQEIKLVITTYDNCLTAFAWQDWLKLEEQFSRLVNPSSKMRAFRRLFIGGAEEHSLDAQGRIRLSSDHKEYAQLEKEVTILGLITRFELWNPHLYKSHIAAQSLDDVTEELSASGIDFAL